MGAQTLEILRQGVWASLTGGWFYDPHQNVFCNTFHFYLWILLLCFPFSIYLYFPPSFGVYYLYCGTVATVFIVLKLVNYALHRMFDTAICIHESVPDYGLPESQRKRALALQTANTILEEEGIELQVLKPIDRVVAASLHDPTDEDSLNSMETATRPVSSTIDLKVDVHRKNSSGSSEEARGPDCCTEEVVKQDDEPSFSCSIASVTVVEKPTSREESRTRPQSHQRGARRTCTCLARNLSVDSDTNKAEAANYELGITTNGSCGVLPQASANSEQLKNTGSLELPIKNSSQVPTSEKGLLYWKQQHLDSSCCDENTILRHSGSSTFRPVNAGESAIDLDVEEEMTKEEEEAKKFLEEEFEWFKGEYSDMLPGSCPSGHASQRRLPNFCSDHNIRENQTLPCLKFQVNSDEDSSDNAGSRSPLLCRHDSLEKARYTYQPGSGQSSEHKTAKSCPLVGKVAKTPLTVYCDTTMSTPDHLASWMSGRRGTVKREIFLHGSKKLSLPAASATPGTCDEPGRLTRERRADMLSWSTERVGLEWLFEHTDSETDCTPACLWKYTHSDDSDSASTERKSTEEQVPCPTPPSVQGFGAIPKTIVSKRSHRHRPGQNKRHGCQPDDVDIVTTREAKKQKNERENGIIDEEETDSAHALWAPQVRDDDTMAECKDASKPMYWRENRETYDSSSGSATELSSLLPLSSLLSSLHPPSSPLLAAFLATRRELPGASQMPGIDDGSNSTKTPRADDCYGPGPRLDGVRSRHHRTKHAGRRRRSRRTAQRMVPLTSVVAANTHIAHSHNDTSQGAVHCFEDEHGNWWSYTFDPSGTATSNEPVLQKHGPRSWNNLPRYKPPDCDSNVNLVSNSNSENESSMSVSPCLPRIVMAIRRASSNTAHSAQTTSTHSSSVMLSRGDSNNNGAQLAFNLARARSLAAADAEEITRHPLFNFRQPPPPPTKHYYKFFYSPWHYIKIRFDRLELIALFDHNLTLIENCLSLFLSILVSICGILLLSYGFYRDLFAFLLCVTIAGCQYSLLKSVQPDASSPTHGYNRIVIYSRSVYFCLLSAIIMSVTEMLEGPALPTLTLYSVPLTSPSLLLALRDLLAIMLLCFPVLFTLGLFPQVDTFALYILEQVDIHVFGGNAASSLIGAVYCVTRSVVTVFLIFGFAYGALCEKKTSQHILFSIFVSLIVTWSYHLSRSASDPSILWNIVKDEFREKPSLSAAKEGTAVVGGGSTEKEDGFEDPLPTKLKQTVHARLINDLIVCSCVALFVFGIHCSAVFTTLQPDLNSILWVICGCSGLLLHYIIPQLRKQLPWLCLSRPILRSYEHGKFEVLESARVMWFEEMVVVLCFLERNVLYPVLVLAILTSDAPRIADKFGALPGALITTVCGVKVMRCCFSQTSHQFLVVGFAALLLHIDFNSYSETFLVDYFFLSIVFSKTYEFLLKIQFVVTYIAPWQITWGSAFHAFAQPFSVPHSAMLFVQAAISAVLSAPLNPFLGSAIFLVSYVRPIKFWERDYNTKRVDQSNTRLSSHLERNLGSDDNNLNSIFYEHLTRSLQHSLCGDLMMGRWGPVSQGDCFVLASDYLNCLVHIIEMGNGLVTFQMRGLEFRGTYCQQREVEAISEGVEENEGCCCCEPGHLPNVLSVNAAFSQRWLAWEVTATKYVLEGYSISDNSAASMLQVFDFRKVLVTYYVKGIIWYCVRSPKLEDWLSSRPILSALQSVSERSFVDLDPVFNVNIDQDFDFRAEGITRSSFCGVYLEWIQFCAAKREKQVDKSRESPLVSLCLALSLMARRALGTASHNTVSSVEFFLYGLHALFKGDFRITSVRDEWVFSDMELLKRVVAPAVRMSLKLHQDHFMSPEEYEDNSALYSAMEEHDEHLVISHEGDPAWRSAVLSGTPSLLALRHVLDDGTDEYKVIMLNKRFLSFRVIKLNRECVRGLWAGQQQELIFLRNRNPERGSIQNAKQALRNMINSSCDQPIGYPIYVSPLTTSYADTNAQLSSIIGGPVSLQSMRNVAWRLWKRVRQRCRQGCSSGSVSRDDSHFTFGNDGVYVMTQGNIHSGYGHSTSGSQSMDSSQMQLGGSNRGGSLGRSSLSGRGSFPMGGKPSSATLVSLAGLLSSAELAKGETFLRERETSFTSIRERQIKEDCCRRHEEKRQQDERRDRTDERKDRERSEEKERRRERRVEIEESIQRVRIVDPKQVFDAINLGRRIDVLWPDENMRSRGGRSYWKHWLPDTGMEGAVVHRWVPNHRDPGRRSHVDKTILLLRIGERYVPIAETGVEVVNNPEASPSPPQD